MNEQAYKYVAELIHELYEEKLKVHRYRTALEEIREMLGSQVWAIGDDDTVEEIRNKIDEVLK